MSQTYFSRLRQQFKVKVDSFSRAEMGKELPKDAQRIVIKTFEDRGQQLERVLYVENETKLIADVIEKVKVMPEQKKEVETKAEEKPKELPVPKVVKKPIVKQPAKPKAQTKPKTQAKQKAPVKPKPTEKTANEEG